MAMALCPRQSPLLPRASQGVYGSEQHRSPASVAVAVPPPLLLVCCHLQVYNKPLPGIGWQNNSLFSFWNTPFDRKWPTSVL